MMLVGDYCDYPRCCIMLSVIAKQYLQNALMRSARCIFWQVGEILGFRSNVRRVVYACFSQNRWSSFGLELERSNPSTCARCLLFRVMLGALTESILQDPIRLLVQRPARLNGRARRQEKRISCPIPRLWFPWIQRRVFMWSSPTSLLALAD